MESVDNIKAEIIKLFLDKGNEKTTAELYCTSLLLLFKRYNTKMPLDISEKDINNYLKVLNTKKVSHSSFTQFTYAAEYFYNEVNNKKYKFDYSLKPKRTKPTDISITQEQIFQLIEKTVNPKHKAIIAIMYSCALEIPEVTRIKLTDLSTRNHPFFLKVHDNKFNHYRNALLSQKVKEILVVYYNSQNPKPKNNSWLFTGNDGVSQYSEKSVSNVISQALVRIGLNLDIENRILKKSYMRHMIDLGIPLSLILNSMGRDNYESHNYYTQMFYKDSTINFTPLDKIILKPSFEEDGIKELESLIIELKNNDEKEYLFEGISCFRAGAVRAGIVFVWAGVMRNLQQRCVDLGLNLLNNQLHTFLPKKTISTIEDFENISDKDFLILVKKLGILTKHIKVEMENHLDLRNHCAHPSSYAPGVNKAKSFIEDMILVIKNK